MLSVPFPLSSSSSSYGISLHLWRSAGREVQASSHFLLCVRRVCATCFNGTGHRPRQPGRISSEQIQAPAQAKASVTQPQAASGGTAKLRRTLARSSVTERNSRKARGWTGRGEMGGGEGNETGRTNTPQRGKDCRRAGQRNHARGRRTVSEPPSRGQVGSVPELQPACARRGARPLAFVFASGSPGAPLCYCRNARFVRP